MTTGLRIQHIEGTPSPELAEAQRHYVPYGAALQFFYCRSPEVLLDGPSGTGKSRAALEKLHLCARKYAGSRHLMCRKTRRSLTQSIMVTFEEKVLEQGSLVHFHHEDQEYRYPNGSKIVVGGLDDPEKIKSTDFDLAYINEATEVEDNDWEMVTTRLRNNVMPYQQLIADCNPGAPTHWLNKRCDGGRTKRLLSRHEDNPTVTPEYLAKLDQLTGYRYKRLRLGLWVAAEGMYFEDWDPEIHVVKPFRIPGDWTRWTTTDYGYAVPFGTWWIARDNQPVLTPGGLLRPLYVYREVYGTGLHDYEQAELIKAKCAEERIVAHIADRSMFNERKEQGKPSIAKVYQQHGVDLAPASNQRIAGWQAMLSALAHDLPKGEQPRLKIFDTCLNLIRTIPEMVHDPIDPEDLADEVNGVKTEDHPVDAIRYGLLAEDGITIGDRRVVKPHEHLYSDGRRVVKPYGR